MAFDEVHGVKRLPVQLARLVNSHNVIVLKTGRRSRFGVKTPFSVRRRERSAQQNFQRDDPPKASLPRPIHDTHSAARDFFEQFVIPKVPAGGLARFDFDRAASEINRGLKGAHSA